MNTTDDFSSEDSLHYSVMDDESLYIRWIFLVGLLVALYRKKQETSLLSMIFLFVVCFGLHSLSEYIHQEYVRSVSIWCIVFKINCSSIHIPTQYLIDIETYLLLLSSVIFNYYVIGDLTASIIQISVNLVIYTVTTLYSFCRDVLRNVKMSSNWGI